MILSVFGINHKTSTLKEREVFQISRRELGEAVMLYKRVTGVDEVAIVATCNRIEFYRAHSEKGDQGQEVVEFYRARGVEHPEKILELNYRHIGAGAARHLFRVISGMDSLVIGEDQIRGQVKDAYSQSCAFGGPGKVLHKLIHHGFRVSKRIKNETTLGDGIKSVPGAAVDMLLENFVNPEKALVVGANETTEAVLKALRRKNVKSAICNRTEYTARKLATAFDADVVIFGELAEEIKNYDLIFSATGSPDCIICGDYFKDINKNIWIADLAVPRDVNPEVGKIKGINLVDLQDLKHHIEKVAVRRCEQLPEAQELVEEQVSEFLNWLHDQEFSGGIERVKRELHEYADAELQRFKGSFHKSEVKALEAFSHALIKKFLKVARRHFEPVDIEPLASRDPAAVEELKRETHSEKTS